MFSCIFKLLLLTDLHVCRQPGLFLWHWLPTDCTGGMPFHKTGHINAREVEEKVHMKVCLPHRSFPWSDNHSHRETSSFDKRHHR